MSRALLTLSRFHVARRYSSYNGRRKWAVRPLTRMQFLFWRACSGNCPIPRGVRLRARFGCGKIRLCSIELTQGEIAIGALRSARYPIAILPAGDIWEARQQYCDDTRGAMCHAVSKSSRRFADF